MKIDKRTKFYKTFSGYKTNDYVGSITFGLLAGLLAGIILFNSLNNAPKTSPQPVEQSKPIIQQVEAQEPLCNTPIAYIRCSGERLGKTNEQIMTMIRIARAESNFRPRAKNPNSTASGIFQIIYGTWNSNNCQGSAFNFVNNIDCAWEIQSHRGFQPWVSSSKVWNK